MTRATYRFRAHTMQPDPAGEDTLYAMECKTGGCEERSPSSEDPSAGGVWAVEHFKANQDHTGYREIITRAYRFWPGDWQ
ncbi:DUF7848 domain-containing protein [Streptomyces erythrochromogenes]|uniref:DUF7848 domain-containing protein n=1 Tax=Streptomyces erythrochromogenes TaxID=285574 RepID=UPI0037CEC846